MRRFVCLFDQKRESSSASIRADASMVTLSFPSPSLSFVESGTCSKSTHVSRVLFSGPHGESSEPSKILRDVHIVSLSLLLILLFFTKRNDFYVILSDCCGLVREVDGGFH